MVFLMACMSIKGITELLSDKLLNLFKNSYKDENAIKINDYFLDVDDY